MRRCSRSVKRGEVAHVAGDGRQRFEGLAIGRLKLEQGFPGVFGAARLVELAARQARQSAQRFDLGRGIVGPGP